MRIIILMVLDVYLMLHAAVHFTNSITQQSIDASIAEMQSISQNFQQPPQADYSHESPRELATRD